MIQRHRVALALGLGLGVSIVSVGLGRRLADRFNHAAHSRLFPLCTTCHQGAAEPGTALWPVASSCTSCHDGETQERVEWAPRTTPAPTNLRFDHDKHRDAVSESGDTAATLRTRQCVSCHAPEGAARMSVHRAEVGQCLSCHGVTRTHLAQADSSCSGCHVPLAEAEGLSVARIAEWPRPPSHDRVGFASEGHGWLARDVAALMPMNASSCGTCHARDFCAACHVNAIEEATIANLPADPRSVQAAARALVVTAPPSHEAVSFLAAHGPSARAGIRACAACHTKESCLTCHVEAPRESSSLAAAGPGRGPGAIIERRPPPSHGDDYVDVHAVSASTSPASCAACHTSAQCLDCHRPSAAATGVYHTADFLSRHPSAAWARETSCSDCHNVGSFCVDCHRQSGLTAQTQLRAGYHDGQRLFTVGHGQAARQGLETCVSCHTERDCLRCHSATAGPQFNPHGPGFDAQRLRQKNLAVCTVCHGTSIPDP